MNRLRFILVVFAIYVTTAHADFDTKYQVAVPESIQSITLAEQLRVYIDSDNYVNRVAACIRLGEIKGQDAFELLKYAFDKEPFREGMELPDGVRYYALVNIGRCNASDAEALLVDIALHYSNNIDPSPDRHLSADSLSVVRGAFRGLSEIGNASVVAALDSVFNNRDLYWLIRSFAQLDILRHELKDYSIKTASDTTVFLIAKLDIPGAPFKQFNSDGTINTGFMIEQNILYLLYEYRKVTYQYISDFIIDLPAGDPKAALLEALIGDIENNPPQ